MTVIQTVPALPKDFKETKFYVGSTAESHAVQKAMFELGFCWTFHRKGQKREPWVSSYANPAHWLYVDKDCRIYWDNTEIDHNLVLGTPKAAFQSALFNAANAHKAKKAAERKAKRARNGGWIAHTRDRACPVAEGTLVDVKYHSGKVLLNRAALTAGTGAGIPFWRHDNMDNDIVFYRLTKPATPVSHVVPFEDMLADIVRGAEEMLPAIPPGFIRHFPTETSTNPAGPDAVVDLCLRDGFVSDEMIAKYCSWGLLPDNPTCEIVGYRVYGAAGITVVPLPVAPVVPAAAATPDTNPKKQFGDKSIPLNLWPALASAYGALGLYNGKLKYGQSNFNATPVEASIYIAGALRHLSAWAEGEEFDPADDVPNLGGVLANIAILLEARAAGTLIDDRKLGSGYLKEREALKEIVQKLNVRHADKAPRHYTLADAVV